MIESFRRVLVLSAHPDDAEIGAGGTIARLRRSGSAVTVFRLSECVESLGVDASRALLVESVVAAGMLDVLGVQADFPVRRFSFKRQAILDSLIAMRDTFAPDLVLVHANGDTHQDHEVLRAEALRAFRCTVFGYESTRSNHAFHANTFVALGACDVDAKVAAVLAYSGTQGHRLYMRSEFIRGLAVVRGIQCDAKYAEGFELLRLSC